MLLNCGVGEDSWESLGLQGDPTSPFLRRSVLNFHWKDWCWSWNSNTLATWCKELTHWKRPWCWGRLKAGGEGDDRGLNGWIASLSWWTWIWVGSGSWWWTLACCSLWGCKESDTTEQLNWTETSPLKNLHVISHPRDPFLPFSEPCLVLGTLGHSSLALAVWVHSACREEPIGSFRGTVII